MSRAKVTIPFRVLDEQLRTQGWMLGHYNDSQKSTDVVLYACPDCVVMPPEAKEPRTVEDIRRDLQTAWEKNTEYEFDWPNVFFKAVLELIDLKIREAK